MSETTDTAKPKRTRKSKPKLKTMRNVKLYLDPKDPKKYLVIPLVYRGNKSIDVPIIMDNAHLKLGRKGKPFECILSNAIEEHAAVNPDAYPHQVLHAYVIKSAVYIISNLQNGQTIPAVGYHYLHNYRSFTDKFDMLTPRTFKRRFKDKHFTLLLYPAKTGGHSEKIPGRVHGNPGRGGGKLSTHMASRGALLRAVKAGYDPLGALRADLKKRVDAEYAKIDSLFS